MNQKTIARISRFSKERDWDQFHSPANLAKSISIEAGELLECFQWDENNYDRRGVYHMMYVQKVNKETAMRRRIRFNKLREEVRKGILPPLDDEMFRVHDLTFLLPDDAHPDEGRMIRDHALYDIYDRRAAGPELEKAVYDHAESYIREHGDTMEVLTAVLDEVEKNVQIPQEDQASA